MDSYCSMVSIVLLMLSAIFRWIRKSSPKMPPGPRGLPILGYLPFLRDDLHNQLTELAAEYGPIYKLRLGNKLYVVISSPFLIKEVARDTDAAFSSRDASIAVRIATVDTNDIALCPYGPQWRDSRKLFVHDLMNNRSLDASYNLRKDEVRKSIMHVYSSKIGATVDISELIYTNLVNVMMSMAWGSTIQGDAREKIGARYLSLLSTALEVMGKPNISDYFPVLARFDVQGVAKEMTSVMKRTQSIIEEIVDEAMERSSDSDMTHREDGRTDFIQMIVELKEKDQLKMPLTKTQLIGMFVDIMASANDSSSTMIWVMAEIMNNPDVMEKVKMELNEVVGLNNIVEEFHVSKLVYLDATIKEAMRLHPIAPFLIPRLCIRSSTLGGYTIPKDTGIFLNIWSVQRDPQVFNNPSEFKPERFLDNNNNVNRKWDFRGNNSNFLPFGSGRRICAGLPLAERLMRYILSSLLHSFDWKLLDDEKLDMSDMLLSTLMKRVPLRAIPTPRLCHSDLYV